MVKLIIVVFVVITVSILVTFLKDSQKNKTVDQFPYLKNKFLFSPAEKAFFKVLNLATDNRYIIFGKVRVADVVRVKKMSDRGSWQRAFNLISSKHFDFVLCHKDDLSICLVIELDDKSHQGKRTQKRDFFINSVCKSSGLPILRFPVKANYNVAEIQEKIDTTIGSLRPVDQKIA